MIKKILRITAGTMATLAILLPATAMARPYFAAADSKTAVCEGVGLVSGGNGCEDPADSPNVTSSVQLVISILSIIVGIIAVIMLIIGGLKYITSAGDSNKISSAKNTILYAIIGLAIVALAQVIVRFTINKVNTAGTSTATNQNGTQPVNCPAGQVCRQ